MNPEEREFVVDSGVRMHMVSKKDLNEAELETVRISKNPILVVTANGEVRTKEVTVYFRELDLFVAAMLLESTPGSFTWKTLQRIWALLPLDQWPETTPHQIMIHSSYLVYQRVPLPHLLLLHLHRRKL